MALKRKIKGGVVGFIGYLLSPLSWWNDAFVNVPLALAMAWPISLIWPKAFTAAVVGGYWLTNVVGLLMLQKGVQDVLADPPSLYSRRALLKDLLIATGYTILILALIWLHVLQPLPDYLPKK